ncbi:hypothetical protein AB0L44_41780 [Nonomuraea wenchangensis]|uniref:hypothetical protein n=1 Tax=Nonomuraea wenchangensis TaxID=568860 RepID=UPI00342F25CD
MALRPASDGPSESLPHELGVIAHGPDSARLAKHLTDLLHRWDHERPSQPRISAHPADSADERLPPGYRINRPGVRLTITW